MRVDPYYVNNLVTSLDNVTENVEQLTSEMSNGVRVTSLSADPVAAGENVVLLNEMQQDDSFTTTASTVTGQLQVADSALGSVVTELTSAISKATSANNGTMNSSNVKTIATEISGIRDEVLSLANTTYEGSYIFGGTESSTTPFTQTAATSSSSGTTTYNGDDSVNYLETPTGQKIQLNVSGSDIFLGSGTNSVFAALNALVSDYSSGTVDTTKAVSDTTALNTALNYVSQQRVTIDNSMTQITAASDSITNQETQLTTAQTNLMQADTATVSTQLSLAETQQTALEDVIADVNTASHDLFSKL
jgi:flagellar hook-associated protein 3 FlgL